LRVNRPSSIILKLKSLCPSVVFGVDCTLVL
jgi:hypothetical protein